MFHVTSQLGQFFNQKSQGVLLINCFSLSKFPMFYSINESNEQIHLFFQGMGKQKKLGGNLHTTMPAALNCPPPKKKQHLIFQVRHLTPTLSLPTPPRVGSTGRLELNPPQTGWSGCNAFRARSSGGVFFRSVSADSNQKWSPLFAGSAHSNGVVELGGPAQKKKPTVGSKLI